MVLVELLRPSLERYTRMGTLRNGSIPVEYQLAITLRWLADVSIYDGMDGRVIARSTAYALVHRAIKALNACRDLDCTGSVREDALRSAELLKKAKRVRRHLKSFGGNGWPLRALVQAGHARPWRISQPLLWPQERARLEPSGRQARYSALFRSASIDHLEQQQ